jgi:hypothetical protein
VGGVEVESTHEVRKGEEAPLAEVGLDATSFVVVMQQASSRPGKGVKVRIFTQMSGDVLQFRRSVHCAGSKGVNVTFTIILSAIDRALFLLVQIEEVGEYG